MKVKRFCKTTRTFLLVYDWIGRVWKNRKIASRCGLKFCTKNDFLQFWRFLRFVKPRLKWDFCWTGFEMLRRPRRWVKCWCVLFLFTFFFFQRFFLFSKLHCKCLQDKIKRIVYYYVQNIFLLQFYGNDCFLCDVHFPNVHRTMKCRQLTK